MREFITRALTESEIAELERTGSRAADWSLVVVEDGFHPSQVVACHFEGRVEIACGAELADSHIANYRIDRGAVVRSTTALECRHEATFGVGVEVAAVNENGGRSVPIFCSLTAQVGYVGAMYRHRPQLVKRIAQYAAAQAEEARSQMGYVGEESRIVGAKFIREVNIGRGVTIDGASLIENATLLDGSTVGVDVKLRNSIVAEGARVDLGATLDRCFVGECTVLSSGLTAVDSLFFANSHCENGECCSILAGPYTVSHHKSSLLIAGAFSFFNAGSGTNQSNHLFKSGAVHQAVHRRGCRFGSNAYVMAPAAEGAFTTVIGRHTRHHDTSAMPFSYLIESAGGASQLLPGFALRNYGTVRDVEKWPSRDRRTVRREPISFDEYNPWTASLTLGAARTLAQMKQSDPTAEAYSYSNCHIRPSMLALGIKLYTQYAEAAIGSMLESDAPIANSVAEEWVDCGGAYLPKTELDALLDAFEQGETTLHEMVAAIEHLHTQYGSLAKGWALAALAAELGHTPTADEVAEAIARGRAQHAALRRTAEADLERDSSEEMMAGYGTDATSTADRNRDFHAVRGL